MTTTNKIRTRKNKLAIKKRIESKRLKSKHHNKNATDDILEYQEFQISFIKRLYFFIFLIVGLGLCSILADSITDDLFAANSKTSPYVLELRANVQSSSDKILKISEDISNSNSLREYKEKVSEVEFLIFKNQSDSNTWEKERQIMFVLEDAKNPYYINFKEAVNKADEKFRPKLFNCPKYDESDLSFVIHDACTSYERATYYSPFKIYFVFANDLFQIGKQMLWHGGEVFKQIKERLQ